jgi:hypothetical protein
MDTRVVAGKHLVACELNDEAIILQLESGVYYGLNGVGTDVWKRLETPQSIGDLRDALLQEYEVDPDQCERELLALLTRLASEGLIEITSAKAPQLS